MDSNERRRDARLQVSPPATILRVGGPEKVEILNASFRGLFLRTLGAPPPTNQLVRLRVVLPAKTIDIHVVPVRTAQDGAGRLGIGVRFFALNGEDRRVWETYINSCLAPRRSAA